jgi:hypothetical protein
VTVESLRVETVKVGSRKKAKSTTELLLQFSGALNAGAAQNLGVYHLDQASRTKKGGTKYNKPVALASVSYNASTDTVTLLARSKLNLAQPEELRSTAAQLPDVHGRPLDGNDDGRPGGDFVALLTKSGVKIESIATPSTLTAKAVDALLSAGKLQRVSALFRSHKAM